MGLLTWKQGESRIDGQNIAKLPMRRLWQKIAYVPQARGNALMYTAEEMVLLGRSAHVGMLQQPRQEDVEAARQAMDLVGATSLRHKLFSRMSGGELQMILIARALATRPSMLVLDCLLYTSNDKNCSVRKRRDREIHDSLQSFGGVGKTWLSSYADPVSYTHLDVYKRQVEC